MIILVTGVMGSGETTVGRLLAQRLGWEFADADDFQERLRHRKSFFRHESLLDDQFANLEEPKDAIVVDISLPPEQIVDEIVRQLGITKASAGRSSE
jgi:gluconate kinase